ncbi:hypothetical protein [Ensifer sp. ENS03]|jgi:hypothetical protein|uniref:hypothetical protein n=1 Tax=Ensifer TaxID=106591 RepID=UPI0011B5A48C|nr:hypothetical protein [Ensifer sp. ENS03]MBD9560401.1 hypothetical protein [Ensifer sp. ENS03]
MTISLSFETSLAGKKLILPSFGSRHIGAHHCIAELSRNAILSRLSPVDSRKKTTSYLSWIGRRLARKSVKARRRSD